MTDLETLRAVAALDDAGRVIPARDVTRIPVLTNTGLDPAIRRGRMGGHLAGRIHQHGRGGQLNPKGGTG